MTNADALDLRLCTDSPAVNAGDNTHADKSRIYGETVDIGAFELQEEPTALVPYSTVVDTLNDSFDLTDGEWSLREAIFWATEYSTITFAEGLEGTITLARGQLSIEGALAIDGDNRITIDADQKSRVFYIATGTTERSAILNGLTIQNGKTTGNGGGICNYGALTVTNSTITGNSTSGTSSHGGGIYNGYGALTVTNSTISGNTASHGGGIFNEGALTVTNCKISENSADFDGGIYNDGSLTVTHSTIAGNTASSAGGGIGNGYSSVLNVYNSIIACNTAPEGTDVFNDFATVNAYNTLSSYTDWSAGENNLEYDAQKPLFIDAANDDYRLVTGSQAIDQGNNDNATYADGTPIPYDLTGKVRILYDAVDLGAYEYIVIDAAVLTTFSDVVYVTSEGDVIDAYDGVITLREAIEYANSHTSITDVYFAAGINSVTLDSELPEITGNYDVDGATIKGADGGSDSTRVGGVIVQRLSENESQFRILTISGGTEDDNVELVGLKITGEKSYSGGGIYNSGSLTVTHCAITRNSALTGAGICNYGALTVTNSAITENSASREGGGIYNYGSSATLTVTNCVIAENTSDFYGGGIYSDGSSATLTITNSEISGNSADDNGGGIYSSRTLTVTNSTIAENSASRHGGGIYSSGTLTVTNSTIAGNSASGTYSNGGGVYSSGTLTVASSTISGNSANDNGGGIYSSRTLTVTNSTIVGNSACEGGGIGNYGTLTVTNCAIAKDSASKEGGGIDNYGSLTVTNSTIAGNSADEESGGIGNYYGDLKLYNTIVSLNYSASGVANVYGSWTGNNNLVGDNPWFVNGPVFDSTGKLTNADALDLRLRTDSPAVNAGDNTHADKSRIHGGTVDIGAFELQEAPTALAPYSTVVNTLNDSFDLTDGEWSLREAIYGATEYSTITFADGLKGTITLALGQLSIEGALAIDGDSRIAIDADQKSRVFLIAAGTTVTVTLTWNPTLFCLPVNASVENVPTGVSVTVGAAVENGDGTLSVTITFTIGETGYTAPGANTFWGAIHFVPNTEDDCGLKGIYAEADSFGATVKAFAFDLERNGKIDMQDFIAFATLFNQKVIIDEEAETENPNPLVKIADFDGSGTVDMQDFILFATNFNKKKADASIIQARSEESEANKTRESTPSAASEISEPCAVSSEQLNANAEADQSNGSSSSLLTAHCSLHTNPSLLTPTDAVFAQEADSPAPVWIPDSPRETVEWYWKKVKR